MQVTYSFCGRQIPGEVIEQALELFDDQVGLDQAVALAEQSLTGTPSDSLEQVSKLVQQAQETKRIPEPYQPMGTDELFIERRAHALLLVIARITQYLPEDRELIQELIARASRDKWGD